MTTLMGRGLGGPLAPRAALFLTVAFWVTVYILYTLRSLVVELPFFAQLLPRLLNCLLGASLCGLIYVTLRTQLHHRPFRLIATGATLSLVGSLIYTGVAPLMYICLIPELTMPTLTVRERVAGFVLDAQAYLWVFLAWCFGFLALVYNERSRLREMQLLQAQALAADAQNRMLRYQINPHFLFNTLNTLSTFVLEKRSAAAEATLLALSEFLRYSLSRSPDEMVPLREEVTAQQEYLNIERARFGDRLALSVEVAPDVVEVLLPSLILQPLVENAVKYAVSASTQRVTIELTARREGPDVVITVRDDGPATGRRKSGLGLGLENVRQRLELAFGTRATFRHGPRQSGGYEVVLTVPVHPTPGAANVTA